VKEPRTVSEHFWPGLAVRVAGWVDRWTTPAHWRRARKYAVGLLGVLAQLLVAGVVPAPWDSRAQLLLALATALGVYGVPNERPLSSAPAAVTSADQG
jgi:hypothetical protein